MTGAFDSRGFRVKGLIVERSFNGEIKKEYNQSFPFIKLIGCRGNGFKAIHDVKLELEHSNDETKYCIDFKWSCLRPNSCKARCFGVESFHGCSCSIPHCCSNDECNYANKCYSHFYVCVQCIKLS
jgi:hypothetical protein